MNGVQAVAIAWIAYLTVRTRNAVNGAADAAQVELARVHELLRVESTLRR